MNKLITIIIGLIALLALLTWSIVMEYRYLEFVKDPADLAKTFVLLAFIATLLERGTEVYVFLFRSPKRREMEINLGFLDNKKDKKRKCEIQKNINNYKSRTAQQATTFSLIVAALVAASGVRSLEPHFAYPHVEESQLQFFRFADIVITSGLIAGGTEGVHRAAKVFYGFMDFLKTKTA
jgi:hypothetical protein